MSLIAKKHVNEREAASYKLDRSTVELVKFYSEFIGSPQEHVVNQALLYVFRKDKDFMAWLKANNKPDISHQARQREPKDGTQCAGHTVAAADGKKV